MTEAHHAIEGDPYPRQQQQLLLLEQSFSSCNSLAELVLCNNTVHQLIPLQAFPAAAAPAAPCVQKALHSGSLACSFPALLPVWDTAASNLPVTQQQQQQHMCLQSAAAAGTIDSLAALQGSCSLTGLPGVQFAAPTLQLAGGAEDAVPLTAQADARCIIAQRHQPVASSCHGTAALQTHAPAPSDNAAGDARVSAAVGSAGSEDPMAGDSGEATTAAGGQRAIRGTRSSEGTGLGTRLLPRTHLRCPLGAAASGGFSGLQPNWNMPVEVEGAFQDLHSGRVSKDISCLLCRV